MADRPDEGVDWCIVKQSSRKNAPSPLTLALSPVENLRHWKIACGGRGDYRKTIYGLISDRVKCIADDKTLLRFIGHWKFVIGHSEQLLRCFW